MGVSVALVLGVWEATYMGRATACMRLLVENNRMITRMKCRE